MTDSKVSNFAEQEKEVWKDIEGYEGIYQVSNNGIIRSWYKWGYHSYIKSKNPTLLKLHPSNEGYLHSSLAINGCHKTTYVHRLVAEYFLPNPNNKPQVNHIDGDKTNNDVSNLEWCTASENMQHAFDNGFREGAKGEDQGQSKLKEKDVLEARSAYNLGCFTHQELADAYGVSRSTMTSAINNKTWRHI